MNTCLHAQILWDAENAKLFGDLCRRTLKFCDEGHPCPSLPAEEWILLVSSERGLTFTPPSNALNQVRLG
jgi:hypothetical protein